MDHLNSNGSQAAEKVTRASEDAALHARHLRTYNVKFERVMSFRPQVAEARFNKEPCLRDLIHHYYATHISNPANVDALTKQYIDKLWQANLF